MNDRELEERLQGYYTKFTPESSGRAVAGVDRTLADRRARRGLPLAGWGVRPGLRGAGALAGLAIAVALVAALFPLWGRTGIGPAMNGLPGLASAVVDQAGVARDGALWAVRGRGLSISRDHGQTWTEHELPTDVVIPQSVVVGDADHAWAIGSTVTTGSSGASGSVGVYRTSDGGATWHSTSLPTTGSYGPAELQFVDDKVGFLVLGGLDQAVPGRVGNLVSSIIMRTEDGGVTWTATGTATSWISSQATSLSPDPSPSSSPGYETVWFFAGPTVAVDADTLWTYCGIPVASPTPGSCPLLQVSRDAGATWTPVALPGLGGAGNEALAVPGYSGTVIDGVQFISPTEGYVAVQETVDSADHDRVHYFRTADGGRSWSQVALTEWQQVAVPPIFIDSQHWFQPGLETLVIPKAGASNEFVESKGMNVTSDGGKTWKNVAASLGRLYQVWMSDPLHGAALVDDSDGQHLYLTSDGWQTWQAASLSPAQWPNPSVELVTVPPSGSGTPGASLNAAQTANPSIPVVVFPPGESWIPGVGASQAPPFSPPAERSLTPSAAAPSAGASPGN